MAKKFDVYVDAQFCSDVVTIEERADDEDGVDALVMVGLLGHIMARRRWYGKQKGWADLPIGHMVDSYHIGYRRMKAALDKLVEWNIVTPSPTNAECARKRMPLWYRYDKRADLELPEVVEDYVEEYEEVKTPLVAPKPAARREYTTQEAFFMRRHRISAETYENLTEQQRQDMDAAIGHNDSV